MCVPGGEGVSWRVRVCVPGGGGVSWRVRVWVPSRVGLGDLPSRPPLLLALPSLPPSSRPALPSLQKKPFPYCPPTPPAPNPRTPPSCHRRSSPVLKISVITIQGPPSLAVVVTADPEFQTENTNGRTNKAKGR